MHTGEGYHIGSLPFLGRAALVPSTSCANFQAHSSHRVFAEPLSFALPHRRKGRQMSYLSEFPYRLRTTDDGKHCWVLIKETGEETEVSREVFRELQREQDRLKNLHKPPKPNAGKDSKLHYEINHPLSLDYTPPDSVSDYDPAWLIVRDTPELQVSAAELERQLLVLLTERQLDCYYCCIQSGESKSSYAERNGISARRVRSLFKQIQQKLKNL